MYELVRRFLLNREIGGSRPSVVGGERYFTFVYPEFRRNRDETYNLSEISAFWRPLTAARTYTTGNVHENFRWPVIFDIHHPTSKFIRVGGMAYPMSWFTESEPLVCPAVQWQTIEFPVGTTFKWSHLPVLLAARLVGAELKTSKRMIYGSGMLCHCFILPHAPSSDFGDSITQEQLDENERDLNKFLMVKRKWGAEKISG